jgi:hypothetical protein
MSPKCQIYALACRGAFTTLFSGSQHFSVVHNANLMSDFVNKLLAPLDTS